MSLRELCPVLQFSDLGDERGKLVVIEGGQSIPFDIKRIFYIYESDATVVRGQHANRNSEFVLVNVAGQSKVRITDGTEEFVVELNKPMMGVYIPQMIWKDMYDFSSDSVLLVLASTHYDAQEYIRDYNKGMNPLIPENYYPNGDIKSEPINTWRSNANLFYGNWLNYQVYQNTPYDIDKIGEKMSLRRNSYEADE